MRKYGLILVFALLLSSCYTTTSQQTAGTMTGAMIGNSVGSLFGGLADGSRGTWWGSAVGTIAGAAIGNAINTQKKTSKSMEIMPQAVAPLNLMQQLDIRNIKFVDENHDLKINPQERCQLIFEIYNVGAEAVSNIIPMATVNRQKKHIFMSNPVRIDRIDAGEGLRYTFSIYADKGLRSGTVGFSLFLSADGQKQELVRTFDLSCENPDK